LFVQPWLTNAEKMPRAFPILSELSERHRVVHYDGRGFGLSQRETEHSLEKQLEDLETVVDAAGLDRFALWGFSSGTPLAIEYAARHAERVTRLAVYGGFARWPMSSARVEAIAVLLGDHLGTNRFESFFRELLVPDASDLQIYFLNQALAPDATRADAAAYFRTLGHLDVRDAARAIRVPTFIAHRRDDQLIKLEAGLELASLIPGAELLILSGQNHMFLPGEEEGRRFASALAEFLSAEPDGGEKVVAAEGIEPSAP
jgi:pimeloyl-ACP methyl ester carboxylesterase